MEDILPSTDNFFKYLLTIGLLLIVFTVMYPLQKQKEVDVELLDYNTNTEILNLKISTLKRDVDFLEAKQVKTQNELDSLKRIMVTVSKEEAVKIQQVRIQKKVEFDLTKQNYLQITDSLEISQIKLHSESLKIRKLESYFSFFRTYKIVLLIVGFLFAIVGFRYWIASVYAEEFKKGKDIDETYKSSFVRHIDFVKTKYINSITISIFLMLVIAVILILCFTN